jgi:hypothetical protein
VVDALAKTNRERDGFPRWNGERLKLTGSPPSVTGVRVEQRKSGVSQRAAPF